MPFAKPLPEWNAVGVEPPQSLKDSGWTPRQKPPADYFNWFMHYVYQALLELQQKAGETKTVNGQTPDANGNVTVAAGVTSVNGQTGDITGIETTAGAQKEISDAIAALINGAPGAFDTLKELAEAMGNDPNFATTVLNRLTLIEQSIVTSADKITIVDAGNYFTGDKVEGALQEIGQAINGTRGNLIESVNALLQA